MTMTPKRILLFLAGLFAIVGAAYFFGVFDRPAPQEIAVTQPADPAIETPVESKAETAGAQNAPETAQPQVVPDTQSNEASDPEEQAANAEEAAGAENAGTIVVPSFDVLRVESDGSLVIAGKAAPDSTVEIVAGTSVLATTTAGSNGDFATVLDRALKPGDHTVVLRSITPDKTSATSLETAIISVPTRSDGDVVALVQQPGQPSRLISVSESKVEPEAKADDEPADAESQPAAESTNPDPSSGPHEQPTVSGRDPEKAAEENASASQQQAAAQPAEAQTPAAPTAPTAPVAPAAPTAPQGTQPAVDSPFIEAVEIDGRQVFVAGQAAAGKRVRVYVNDVLLGQATADANGRFLIETERDLPVGDYIVRADVLGNDGVTVTARAAVPFARPAGESMTSVAPAPQAAPSTGTADPTAALVEGDTVLGAALERADGAVIIRRGDTLWHISRRVYGRGIRYTTIYQANKDQIRDPNRIYPGQTFSLPSRSEDGEAANLDAIKDRQAD